MLRVKRRTRMATNFYAFGGPRHDPAKGPPPRGFVEPPPVIREFVAQEQARAGSYYYPDSYAKLTLDDLTLAYYYLGIDVAYRSVPGGVEILAVGGDEIGQLADGMSQEELLTIEIKCP
jgi:hypothetical protein